MDFLIVLLSVFGLSGAVMAGTMSAMHTWDTWRDQPHRVQVRSTAFSFMISFLFLVAVTVGILYMVSRFIR